MGLFDRKEKRGQEADEKNVSAALLRALLGSSEMNRENALQIPSVSGCVNYIASTVSMLPLKLYEETDGEVKEIKTDIRVRLLNDDTGDTLDAVQFWRAMLYDYFLGKGAYAYIRKSRNKFQSVHYVRCESVAVDPNADPIFKDYDIHVGEETYKSFDFLKLLRNTRDGARGEGITSEAKIALAVAYNTLTFEDRLIRKGGAKSGFLEAAKKLTQESLNAMKEVWEKVFSRGEENVVVLNEGVKFTEATATSVEMQLNENKETNSAEICKLFNVPESIIKGTAKESDYVVGFRQAVAPVLRVIECALNRDFLLEKEKTSRYWSFDVKELTKGDMKSRYEAYKIALDSNFLQIDEVRYMEDKPALGLDWIKLGLDSVLYNPKTGEVYTPNTDRTNSMADLKGGEEGENRNPERQGDS